ncbi:MAG: hypothetical protein WBV94_13080 [Blastocatellia bacterium]
MGNLPFKLLGFSGDQKLRTFLYRITSFSAQPLYIKTLVYAAIFFLSVSVALIADWFFGLSLNSTTWIMIVFAMVMIFIGTSIFRWTTPDQVKIALNDYHSALNLGWASSAPFALLEYDAVTALTLGLRDDVLSTKEGIHFNDRYMKYAQLVNVKEYITVDNSFYSTGPLVHTAFDPDADNS